MLSGAVMEDGASSCIALVSGVSLCTRGCISSSFARKASIAPLPDAHLLVRSSSRFVSDSIARSILVLAEQGRRRPWKFPASYLIWLILHNCP